SNGCNITVGVDPRKGKVSRVRPRINMDVNEYWICDRGRYDFKRVQEGATRLKDPILRRGEGFVKSDWPEASAFAADGLTAGSASSVAILRSPTLTSEELYLLKKLGERLGGARVVSNSLEPEAEKLYGIISSDPYPNSRGVRDMGLEYGPEKVSALAESIINGSIKVLYVAGEDIFGFVPEEGHARLREALSALDLLIVEDYKVTETARMAHVILPGVSPYEKDGTFTNDAGRVQRIREAIAPPGIAKPDWEIISYIGSLVNPGGFNDYGHPSLVMKEISA